MAIGAQYTARMSHEFDDGPSGPRRSYWNILSPSGAVVVTLCLHHTGDGANPKSTAEEVCNALAKAFRSGAVYKAQQVRAVIGVTE